MTVATCIRPGTKWGKLADGSYCSCPEHREYRLAQQRIRDRRRRGAPRPTQLGSSWQLGVNALDAAPILRRLDVRGWLAEGASEKAPPAGHPFPEHVPLIRRTADRGWLTLHEADLLCVRVLKTHPAIVYGQAWHDLQTGEPL